MFPTLTTYEAQIICIMEYYDKEIIDLVKKHKKFLKNNNFSTIFFVHIENRNTEAFYKHIQNLASNRLVNWYVNHKTRQTIKKLTNMKEDLSEIDPRDYYSDKNERFNFVELSRDISILTEPPTKNLFTRLISYFFD